MKREIKRFTNDEPYDYPWDCVVSEYLRKGYKNEYDFTVLETTYKVLKRKETTVFYNADETALFDVVNKRLEKEYQLIMSEDMATGEITKDLESAKEKAKEKLEKELTADSGNTFTKPIIGYLLKRCEEDEGLCQDVIQEHKTWKKCFDYIKEKIRSQPEGNRGFVHVPDDVVYEWAEDYYHKDDKAEEEKKAKEEAEMKAKRKKEKEAKKVKAENDTEETGSASKMRENISKEQPETKKSGKDMEGQIDLFSMMGV